MCLWWTHPVALKSITKVPNQKVARRPKYLSYFSCSSDGLLQICMTAAFPLSSAPNISLTSLTLPVPTLVPSWLLSVFTVQNSGLSWYWEKLNPHQLGFQTNISIATSQMILLLVLWACVELSFTIKIWNEFTKGSTIPTIVQPLAGLEFAETYTY